MSNRTMERLADAMMWVLVGCVVVLILFMLVAIAAALVGSC